MALEVSLEDQLYRWQVVSIVKNRQNIINFLRSKIASSGEVEEVFFPVDVGIDGTEKPFMSYIFVKSRPGYLEEIRSKYERAFSVIGEISDNEIKEMQKDFANRKVSRESGIVVGSKVEFIEGNYIGLLGNVEEVSPNGEIGVKVWFMDTVTKVYDQIKNVELYKGK